MELKWLEDLVALAEAETLSAAARRRNISQPAFSRRIQTIEAWLGTDILDRTSRPPRLTDPILDQMEDVRAIIASIRQLRLAARSGNPGHDVIAIAAQQSVATGFLPEVLGHYSARNGQAHFNLHPGNRDECFAKLMSRRAAILVSYETERFPVGCAEPLVEKIRLSSDALVAICVPALAQRCGQAEALPIIVYPDSVFFGAVLARDILPALARASDTRIACETPLLSSAIELALAGLGVAWLPQRIAQPFLDSGRLVAPRLPSVSLRIVAARVAMPHTPAVEHFWTELRSLALAAAEPAT